MAAKFFTGLPLDGPDPECVRGFGEQALAARSAEAAVPRSDVDHSRRGRRKAPVALTLGVRPDKACETSPLVAGSADTRRSAASARAGGRASPGAAAASGGRRAVRLGERTWTEVERTTVLVPVGSLEQHGPHLPLDTDARIAAAVARRAADPSTLIAPPFAYGASGEHEGFAGTLSIGHAALRAVLVELGRSAGAWASRLVFVNGHGGNVATLVDAVELLRYEGRDAAWFGCDPGGDAHAGRTETSMVLALDPALVRAERAAGNTAPLRELLPAMRAGGVGAVSPNGVLGDPAGASAAEGERLLTELASKLLAAVAGWAPEPSGCLR
jgi:creatinine amidohydrolase